MTSRRCSRVCLVTAGLPSTNPRLVKEAAALAVAGYGVRCVTGRHPSELARFSGGPLRGSGIRVTAAGREPRSARLARRLRQAAARRAPGPLGRAAAVAGWAASTQVGPLTRAAAAERADLYIGHTLPALPAAVRAAERHGAVAGFDAEDLHSGETGQPLIDRAAARVEARYLPRCRHLTAAAPLIAEAYAERYGVRMTPVLNAFPRAEMPPPDPPGRGPGDPLRLYWFSQTVGPNRGLEQVLAGAALLGRPVRLSVRGQISDGYRASLDRLGEESGVDVRCLPPAEPARMASLAAEHDVGLSVEPGFCPNNRIALSNKLFTYLTAGRPQLLSRTRGQAAFADEMGDAAETVDLADPASVARGLRALADGPRWRAGAAAARRLGAGRFSWDHEQETFLNSVETALRPPTAGGVFR